MLNDAGIKEGIICDIWAECVSTTTLYANILVNRDMKPPHESVVGKKQNHLGSFGEMFVVHWILSNILRIRVSLFL
jgi:hypothetical protein